MIHRALLAILTATTLLISGCASVPMAPVAEDAARKTFSPPPPDRAGLYIYRNSAVGQALKKTLYVDGKPIGESANKVYFYREVTPGKHVVSTESEFGDNAITVDAQSGMHYFIRQYIKMGVFVGGAGVERVSEEEGRKGVLASRLAQ